MEKQAKRAKVAQHEQQQLVLPHWDSLKEEAGWALLQRLQTQQNTTPLTLPNDVVALLMGLMRRFCAVHLDTLTCLLGGVVLSLCNSHGSSTPPCSRGGAQTAFILSLSFFLTLFLSPCVCGGSVPVAAGRR